MKKTIVLVSDHAGFELKEFLVATLMEKYKVIDFGCYAKESVDYPDYAKKLCEYIIRAKKDQDIFVYGIVICGTGIGMSICCNRNPLIRCALCHNVYTADATRRHNDANVLALGARVINPQMAFDIVEKFLNTDFEGGRHAERLAKI
tara:strand:- start:48 stop:488 length:441 start_codon:yes stop_codon:yes gene_type:complete